MHKSKLISYLVFFLATFAMASTALAQTKTKLPPPKSESPSDSEKLIPPPGDFSSPDQEIKCVCPQAICDTYSERKRPDERSTGEFVCDMSDQFQDLQEECQLAVDLFCSPWRRASCSSAQIEGFKLLCMGAAVDARKYTTEYMKKHTSGDEDNYLGNTHNCIRHVYWQALLTCELGKEAAQIIGDQHEHRYCRNAPAVKADSARDECNNMWARDNAPQGPNIKRKLDCRAEADKVATNAQSAGLCATVTVSGCTYTVNLPAHCGGGSVVFK